MITGDKVARIFASRSLSYRMFVDGALRKSLDQLEEVECGTAPIENFAREWFERFTVGLRAHNEGDVKILARVSVTPQHARSHERARAHTHTHHTQTHVRTHTHTHALRVYFLLSRNPRSQHLALSSCVSTFYTRADDVGTSLKIIVIQSWCLMSCTKYCYMIL